MKKYAKLLCSILVIAALCTSLLFTTGAEEAEPFVKSFEATDYSGQSINNGMTIAKSDVAGNRVNSIGTMNAGNSTFVSIAQGMGDRHIIAYANRDVNSTYASSNNLAVNVGTPNSDPFTVVGDGVKGYYVIDFDVATYGNMLPGFDVSVVLRRASDTSGFPFSDEIAVGNYVTATDSWSHITLVGDLVNNVVKVYINGLFVGNASLAVRNDSDPNKLSGDTQVKALGYRVEFTRNNVAATMTKGDNVALDNFAHRLYIEDSEALGAAVAAGDLTAWEGYTNGRGGEKLPVLVTVDGAEYRNFSNLSRAFATNDTVDVNFLAEPFAPVDICANANINTNGMQYTNLFTPVSGCEIVSVKGNIVSTTAPFVANNSEKAVDFSGFSVTSANIPEIYNATKGNAIGNLYDRFNIVSASPLNKLGTIGYRNGTIISDSVTGNSIYRESAYVAAGATTTTGQNEYSNFNFTKVKLSYEAGKNEYIVIDYDYTYTGALDTRQGLLIIPRGNSGYHATSLRIDLLPVQEGEIVHITAVHDYTNNTAQYFVNGVLTNTVNGGAINSSAHSKYLNNTETINVEEYKLGSNSLNTVYFDNMNIRFFDIDAASDTLADAIAAQDITLWNNNIYTSDYKMTAFPALATVDGVPYHDEASLEKVLYGNKTTPAVVKILHPFTETITVNCDAEIYTYGQAVNFVDAKDRALTPGKNGVILLDIPYMEVKLEQQVTVTGGTNVDEILNAIRFNVTGNRFNSFVPANGNWGTDGYRNASLLTDLDSGNVVYRESLLPNANGGANNDSAEYADMKFAPITLTYADGRNSYIVVDFDFGTDGAIVDDVAFGLVPTSGASASANMLQLEDLGIIDGDMSHVTVVFDFTNNVAYAFVNGLFAYSAEGAVVDSNSAYLAGTGLTVDSFRFFTGNKLSTVCLDNVAIRYFDYSAAEDTLDPAVDAGDITAWSESVYSTSYVTSKLPTLAVVDGRNYGSLDTLNKLLAIESDHVKQVEIKYVPAGAIEIRSEATVETNGLPVNLDWNTGLYEFDPGIDRYKGTRTGLAYASTRFIYTTVGTAYTFKTIDKDNCWSNASVAIWTYKVSNPGQTIAFHDYDVVFYPYGEKMAPIDSGAYIQNGVLNRVTWLEMTITASNKYTITAVSDYPVAGPTESMKIYTTKVTTQNINFAVTDMLYGANISTNINFTFYVENVDRLETDTGNVVVIDGKEYMAFTYELAPNEIDKVITVTFQVREGNTLYTQKQEICFVDYLRELLEMGTVDKSLILSLLNYANEAHALFDENGAKMDSVTELINEYSEYLPNEELTEKLDTSALSSVIRSASLRLNSAPEFVFKVARGFRGTITLSYNSLGNTVEHSLYVNSLASEQIIILKGLGIFDMASDITITVTEHGSDTPLVGQYNLATYAQGLENNAFAVALYNYAKLALQYHTENNNNFPA